MVAEVMWSVYQRADKGIFYNKNGQKIEQILTYEMMGGVPKLLWTKFN